MSVYNIFGQTRREVETWLSRICDSGNNTVRAAHLFREIYRRRVRSAEELGGIHKQIFRSLQNHFDFALPLAIEKLERSESDGSVKFVCRLKRDNLAIETVLIPERNHLTLCVSSQVGCAQACRFCSTGTMGLKRSLTTEEIVAQYLVAEDWLLKNKKDTSFDCYDNIRNIVFMGMGEPLDNLEQVVRATEVFCDPQGLFLSPNRVTISTVGLLPQLESLLTSTGVCVALSLHSPFDEERSKIMPVNTRHPIADIMALLRRQNAPRAPWKKRTFFIQYTVIRNVNDSVQHAEALARLLEGVDAKVNLIPLNEHSGTAMRRPDLGRIAAFQAVLKERGFVATVRLSKGRDIMAACGQLIKKESNIHEHRSTVSASS